MNKIMNIIRKKVWDCEKCGKEYRGRAACGFGKEEDVKVFFVGMNPWTEKGRFKDGKGIAILKMKLKEWDFTDFFLDNVVKCEMPGDFKPNSFHADNCNEFLKLQLRILDPKVLITFGKFAVERFGYCSPWTDKIINKRRIIALPHFSSILYQGSSTSEKIYYQRLEKILNEI